MQFTGEMAALAKAKMSAKLDAAVARAQYVFERIEREVPNDSIVKGKALQFQPHTGGERKADGPPGTVVRPIHQVVVTRGGGKLGVHDHAMGQLAQRAGIQSTYIMELAKGGGWKTELAAHTLNEHYHKGNPDSAYLVRAVKGEMRGFLSDKFRRLDNRPLLDTLVKELKPLGAVPWDAVASDVRVSFKFVHPEVYEPIPGEYILFGGEWHNSDYGAGKHTLRAFIVRLVCTNGASLEDLLGQVHLGKRLSDDIQYSQRTYELDTKASASALRDTVKALFDPRRIELVSASMKAAASKEVTWRSLAPSLARRLLKSELEEAKKSFESEDVVNLPAGNTVWRASNALSWLAVNSKDADRKLELERLAGEVLTGKRDAPMAEAA